MRRLNGGVIGRNNTPNVRTAPGIWTSREQYLNTLQYQWPVYYPGYNLTTMMNSQTLYEGVKITPGPTSNMRNVVIGDYGYRAFMVSLTYDTIHSYSLSDPYNVASMTKDNISLAVGSKETYPTGIYCSDGYNLYVIGESSDRVHWYSMSNGWDLSSAVFTQSSPSLTAQSSTPRSLSFSPDGSKLFILTVDRIYQYSLSSPGDLSTVTYDNISYNLTYSVTKLSDCYQLVFNDNGNKLFIVASGSNMVAEFILPTAYNLVGMQFSGRNLQTNLVGAISSPYGIAFNDNGSRLFISSTNQVAQYKIGSAPYTLQESPGYAGKYNSSSLASEPEAVTFSSDGYNMYLADDADRRFYQYYLSTPWDVTTASYTGVNFYYPAYTVTGVLWKPDGTKFWLHNTSTWYQHSCSTPWNLGTAYQELSVPNVISGAYCSFFDPYGLNLYVGITTDFTIRQYSLSIPYTISTATLVGSVALKTMSYLSQDYYPRGLAFSSDGSKMYVYGVTSGRVYQYNLGSAWDITTANWDDQVNFYIGYLASYNSFNGMAFKPDGTKFFITTNASPGGVLQFFTGP